MAKTIKSIGLEFREGSSDKVYYISIEENGGKYDVPAKWGRRGNSFQEGLKAAGATLAEAEKMFNKTVGEKQGKGYKEIPGSSTAPAGTTVTVGQPRAVIAQILPQLCNDLGKEEADMEPYILNDVWAMEEKYNGTHKTIIKVGNIITVTNKYGQVMGCRQEVLSEAGRIVQDFTLDVEDEVVGGDCIILGLLSLDGEPLTSLKEGDRRIDLVKFSKDHKLTGILRISRRAVGAKDKRKLLQDLKDENAEGAIFKNVLARHAAGRPNKGGNHLKFKFWKTMSVIVAGHNLKSSVQIAVLRGITRIPIGDVTIPSNKTKPDVNAIIEVRYLYVHRGGKMFQTTFLEDRSADMRLDEPDQKIKKHVLEQLQETLLHYKQDEDELKETETAEATVADHEATAKDLLERASTE